VLYADPDRRFTLLSLVWMPGQFTPVHGHTAWGVVGVYAGTPTEARFARNGGSANQTGVYLCSPGDVATTAVGTQEMHRILNASTGKAVTLHCYGRDLLEDPCCINIVYAD
jgi:predicted metal-dependent enzyme (double-stranded beta helix superfamily)